MAQIFLCYRSGDDAYAAALLDDKLSAIFGPDHIFRASRSIRPGQNYSDAIMHALEECQTMLVLIGPHWADRLTAPDTHPSTDDTDWVRIEIATALKNHSRVIPVLLSRATRLVKNHLPPEIADLAYHQYLTFEHRNVERDLDQLVAALTASEPGPTRTATTARPRSSVSSPVTR